MTTPSATCLQGRKIDCGPASDIFNSSLTLDSSHRDGTGSRVAKLRAGRLGCCHKDWVLGTEMLDGRRDEGNWLLATCV